MHSGASNRSWNSDNQTRTTGGIACGEVYKITLAHMNERQSDYPVLPARPQMTAIEGGCLRVLAPAKINLNLLVGPRRADGFHPVDSLVAKVTLYDELELRPREDGQITLACEGRDCGPADSNLVLGAAKALAERTGHESPQRELPGVAICLRKHIPPGGGLGGGSSDAAATLMAMNDLWRLGLGLDELSRIASQLGSDCPLFLGPPGIQSHRPGRGDPAGGGSPVRGRAYA